jgi:hypothetical protein
LLFIGISCKKINSQNVISIPPVQIDSLPQVITDSISNQTYYSVTLEGKIIDTGLSKVTEQGIVVDAIPEPTITKNLNKFVLARSDSNTFKVIVGVRNVKSIIFSGVLGIIFFFAGISLVRNTNDKAT